MQSNRQSQAWGRVEEFIILKTKITKGDGNVVSKRSAVVSAITSVGRERVASIGNSGSQKASVDALVCGARAPECVRKKEGRAGKREEQWGKRSS